MIIVDSYKYRDFLLDRYPAAVAYSLRKLKTGVTNVVRVRRSSDNTEQDFTSTQITDGTLTTFCGVGNGFVTTWYDQSGNNYHVNQTTQANQPQIVASGVVITDNGKPALTFDGVNNIIGMATNITISMVTAVFNWESIITNFESSIGSATTTGVNKHIFILDNLEYKLYTSTASLFSSPDSNYWVNGVNTLTTGNGQKINTAGSNSVLARLIMGRDFAGGGPSGCKIQEIIAYANTANRTAIESNMNSYYQIY